MFNYLKTSQILDQSFQAATSKDFSSNSRIDECDPGKQLESILEHMVSFRDVPAMKELLTIQKKIRNLLDEWLNYCRTSLNIMAPSMYILPELKLVRNNNTKRNMSRSQLNNRSRSAEMLRSALDFNISLETPREFKLPDIFQNEKMRRAKSAFIGKLIELDV